MNWPPLSADLILVVLEAAAVLTSAVAGMIVASNKSMDIVGAYCLACANAFGGGTVRDLLLDNRPFYWMQHWGFLLAIMAICVPFVYSARMFRLASAMHRRSVNVDALGLALFTITGTGVALAQGTPLLVAALEYELIYSYAAGVGIAAVVSLRVLSVRLGLAVPAPHWQMKP